MTARKARFASMVIAAVAMAALAASATVAGAFPTRTNYCTNCHSTAANVAPTATLTSNDGVNATYSVSVSNPWNDGVTGWAVFDSTLNIRNGYGASSFSVPVGKTYRVYGVAGIGGAGANFITISPAAPAPADTTAPTVSLTSPANGATVAGSVALAATAADAGSGVASVEFHVDGVLVGIDTTAPYGATWDATLAAPGSHLVEAIATDAAGNTASTSISVTIASPPPPVVVELSDVTITVNGSTGAPLAGAKVVIVNLTTGARLAALTAADGTAVFGSLPYGDYRAQASFKGKRRTLATFVADAPTEAVTITLLPRR